MNNSAPLVVGGVRPGGGGEGVFVFNYDSESQLETENSAGARRFVNLSDLSTSSVVVVINES